MKIPSNINKNIKGQYCLRCYSTKINRIFRNSKTYYFCDDCQTMSERILVIDNMIKWWIDSDDNYWHESVGVIILNEKNKLLIIMRAIYPFAYALPAGHVNKGEEFLAAAQRETAEEIGISLPKKQFKLICNFQLPNDSCRRGSDHHLWHLYLAKIKSSDHIIQLNDESVSFHWLDIKTILSKDNITYPLKYIITNFGNKIL